ELAGGPSALPAAFTVEGDPVVGIGDLVARPRSGADPASTLAVDVVFPLLHGPYGEDGTVQGLLELADLPYVGSGVVGSAVAMDKIAMKQAFLAAGLPVARWMAARETADRGALRAQVRDEIGFPCFVKPANLG